MANETAQSRDRAKLTAPEIQTHKGGSRLSMVSVYDYPFARLAQEAGIDILLVGDSLGMVVQGHDSTVPVTLDHIIYHTKAVRRGAPTTHIVADMPFLTYQLGTPRTIENAGRLLQEGGADSVKIEGGQEIADQVAAIARTGIPVMGHIGLTPQSAGALGGFKVQGRDVVSARKILADARAIADAGAYAMVVEVIPAELGAMITDSVPVPTIGIGAGPSCDGQVLVAHDLLGVQEHVVGRFVKTYGQLGADIRDAFAAYAAEVRDGAFPGPEHSYRIPPDVLDQLRLPED